MPYDQDLMLPLNSRKFGTRGLLMGRYDDESTSMDVDPGMPVLELGPAER